MFAKTLKEISKPVPNNSLILVKSTCNLTDSDTGSNYGKGTVFGIIRTEDGTFIGTVLTKNFSLFESNGDIRNFTVDIFENYVRAYKPVVNPTIYSLELLATALIEIYGKFVEAGKPSLRIDMTVIQATERAVAQAKLEADIKALKLRMRAERKQDFYNNMRPVIADEARAVLAQISVDQHDEVIATITSIVERVADEIVTKNYKLVEDYYDQAYLQTIQLGEKIRDEVVGNMRINLKILEDEVNTNTENFEKKIKRLENIHALQVQALNTEKNYQLQKMRKAVAKAKAATKKPVKKVATKKPVKKAVKKKAK